jgi:hypothetical protein
MNQRNDVEFFAMALCNGPAESGPDKKEKSCEVEPNQRLTHNLDTPDQGRSPSRSRPSMLRNGYDDRNWTIVGHATNARFNVFENSILYTYWHCGA